MVDEQTYLAHYGVKGMKWGVRKENDSGRLSRIRETHQARSERRKKENKKRAKKIKNINDRLDKKYGIEGQGAKLGDARLFKNASYSIGQRYVGNLISAGSIAVIRRGGITSYTRMGSYGKTAALMDLGVSAASAAFVTKMQDVKVDRALRRYKADGTVKKEKKR